MAWSLMGTSYSFLWSAVRLWDSWKAHGSPAEDNCANTNAIWESCWMYGCKEFFPTWVISFPALHIAWTHPELMGGEQHLVIKHQFSTKSSEKKKYKGEKKETTEMWRIWIKPSLKGQMSSTDAQTPRMWVCFDLSNPLKISISKAYA